MVRTAVRSSLPWSCHTYMCIISPLFLQWLPMGNTLFHTKWNPIMQCVGAHNCEIKVTVIVWFAPWPVFKVRKDIFPLISTDITRLFSWENNSVVIFSLSDISLQICKTNKWKQCSRLCCCQVEVIATKIRTGRWLRNIVSEMTRDIFLFTGM